MPTRREFLQAAAFSGAARAAAQRTTPPNAKPPNIVIFLADDQGWGDLSVNGNTNLSTPNIDSLARDGVLFEHFYVCPVCAPTRAEFLTGRYHAKTGVRGVSDGDERMNLGETTIAEVFEGAGYATGAFGKWHNGSQFPYHPNARGFGEFYGFLSGHWGEYFSPELDHNGTPVRGDGYLQDDLTNHAMAFIQQHKQQPFFCYLAYNTPHSPMQVPEKFFEKFSLMKPKMTSLDPAQEEIPMTRAALAMVENLDWNVGRVLSTLHSLDLERDTIVLYFSDNGPNSWRWNGAMKGRKGSTDEGGVRSPCIMRWPEKLPAGKRIARIAGAIDLLPTLVGLAGLKPVTGKPLDGINLRPLLEGDAPSWPDRLIYSLQNKQVSARSQRYRLDSKERLFDMEQDPSQTHDLSAAQPQVALRMREAVRQWSAEMMPLVSEDLRPYTVGFAKRTALPAGDGIAHGSVQRSNQYPNCSYFLNWRALSDSITWDIETSAAGDYEAQLFYTAPAANLGAVVELAFAGRRVSNTITVAHDPPLAGMADDRVRRIESYMKPFRQLSLGTIYLPQARGTLTLRATRIPGPGVADVWNVVLIRKS